MEAMRVRPETLWVNIAGFKHQRQKRTALHIDKTVYQAESKMRSSRIQ